MLLKLLKRDLRLHWDVLVVPFGVVAMLMGGLSFINPATAIFGALILMTLFIPFLPMALHLREGSQGTLPDLVALPLSRRALVELRILELVLLSGLALILGHLATWAVESIQAHRLLPLRMMGTQDFTPVLVLLIACFAYPLPFLFRWEAKGLVGTYGLIFGASLIASRLPEKPKLSLVMGMLRFVEAFVQHPGRMALLTLGLFTVSYLASVWAFSRREL